MNIFEPTIQPEFKNTDILYDEKTGDVTCLFVSKDSPNRFGRVVDKSTLKSDFHKYDCISVKFGGGYSGIFPIKREKLFFFSE